MPLFEGSGGSGFKLTEMSIRGPSRAITNVHDYYRALAPEGREARCMGTQQKYACKAPYKAIIGFHD